MPLLLTLRPAVSKTAAAFKAGSPAQIHPSDLSASTSYSNSMSAIGTGGAASSAPASLSAAPAPSATPQPAAALATSQPLSPSVSAAPTSAPPSAPSAPLPAQPALEALAAHAAAPLLQALASATGTAALSIATSVTAATVGQLSAHLAHTAGHTATAVAQLASATGAGPEAEDPGDYHWAVGVVLAALAAVVSNVGLNFQKLTHIQNQDQGEKAKQNYWRSKLWLAGLVMIILGSVMDFAALAFGAQSIIAPLGSLTLVSNVFFAPCLLGETLTLRDVLATITIVLGASIAVAFASHKDTIYSLEELFGFYQQPRFGLYAIGVLVAIGVLWSAIQYMETIRKEAPRSPHYARLVKYHRFCYAALSGTIGAQSVLFAKCTAELVVNTVMGQGFLLSYYQTWMVIICMCTTIFLQLKWLNQGLQRFDALYIVPVFQSFWILVSVIAGLIFFGEGGEMTQLQTIMFPIGVSLTVVGVYFLSQRGVDDDISSRPHGHARKDSVPKVAAAAGPKEPAEVKEEEPAQPDVESATEPLIPNQSGSSQPGGPAARPIRDPRKHRHLHQRIDSTVGFGGTGSPAAMLPTRAMVLGASLRPEDTDEPAAEVDDDDI